MDQVRDSWVSDISLDNRNTSLDSGQCQCCQHLRSWPVLNSHVPQGFKGRISQFVISFIGPVGHSGIFGKYMVNFGNICAAGQSQQQRATGFKEAMLTKLEKKYQELCATVQKN